MQQFQVQKKFSKVFLIIRLELMRKALRIFRKVSQDKGEKPRGVQNKVENK